ncbi:MAG: hypothetical protein GXO50_00555 [Chlorobi bacterium]|nr:hypothetical protein [Chlorobiota bacterium]
MKKITILLPAIIFAINLKAQKIPEGDWLLTKTESSGGTRSIYQTFSFKKDGSLIAFNAFEVGKWKFDEKNNSIILSSKADKDFNGALTIIKQNKNEFTGIKDGVKYFYVRINENNISKNNKESALINVWKFQKTHDDFQYLKFELPDKFVLYGESYGMQTTSTGNWIYSPEDSSFILIAFSNPFRGKYKIIKHTSSELDFKNEDRFVKSHKITDIIPENRELTFTVDEIPEENEDELPETWTDLYEIINTLKPIKRIVYKKGKLLNPVGILKYSEIFADVNVNEEDESITFNFSEYADNDTVTVKKIKKDAYSANGFFPEEEFYGYRITGKEKLQTPAGTFNCIVVEAIGDDDEKIKLWMPVNLPGIYAKIIKSGVDSFGEKDYSVQILTKIIR